MTVWIILGAVAALTALLLSLWVKIILVYAGIDDGSPEDAFQIRLRILCFTIPILPKKQKKVRLRDFTYRGYERLKRKERKKQRSAAKKQKRQAPSTSSRPAEKTAPAVSDVPGMMEMLQKTIGKILTHFLGHLRVDIVRFRVRVSAQDAAATGILYGVAVQGAAYLLETLRQVCRLRDLRQSKTSVEADFLSGKSTADIQLVFRLRVAHLLDTLLHMLLAYAKADGSSEGQAKLHKDQIKRETGD